MAGKITLVDGYRDRWHHRLIFVQVVINYRKKWGTDIILDLTRVFQLSTDTCTVDRWYSSARPVRGPVARQVTGSNLFYGQHLDLCVARKSTTSPLPVNFFNTRFKASSDLVTHKRKRRIRLGCFAQMDNKNVFKISKNTDIIQNRFLVCKDYFKAIR